MTNAFSSDKGFGGRNVIKMVSLNCYSWLPSLSGLNIVVGVLKLRKSNNYCYFSLFID